MPPPGACGSYWSVSYLSQLFTQLSESTAQAVFFYGLTTIELYCNFRVAGSEYFL